MSGRKIQRVAVMTAGGDCPGLNAVIRSVTKTCIHEYGISVLGVRDGYAGLVDGKFRELEFDDCSGILQTGGTMLGSSNWANPFAYPDGNGDYEDRSADLLKNFKGSGADALVCIGGDGTLRICRRLMELGIPAIVVPKTIDNDVPGTDASVGYDSALHVATEAVDRLHSTAASHHRTMIVEVMGRDAGWIALGAGVAGGADVILIPEIPYRLEPVCQEIRLRSERHRKCSIVVVAEGAKPEAGERVVREYVDDPSEPARLGGIGNKLAAELEERTGIPTRTTTLGHVQRGGPPTPADRLLGTMYGARAADLLSEGRLDCMVGLAGAKLVTPTINSLIGETRFVPLDHPWLHAARAVRTVFGDEEKVSV